MLFIALKTILKAFALLFTKNNLIIRKRHEGGTVLCQHRKKMHKLGSRNTNYLNLTFYGNKQLFYTLPCVFT